MSEWKEYKFSDFVEINPNVTLPSDECISYVEMKDLNESEKFCFPSSEREKGNGSKFQNYDTLFAKITPCLENGKICQVRGLKNNVGLGSTEFIVFRGKRNISDTDFIFYLSRWDEVRSHAEINLDGTSGRQRVPIACFDDLIIKMPVDIDEQKAIASILSCLDDKIDLLHRQNATLEKMGETLFRQWFVERESLNYDSNDFYDGHEFKNQGNQPNQKNQGSDNVEETKEEWEEGTLGDVIEIYDNLRVPLSKMERDKKKDGQLYPYYGAAQIMDYINDYIFDGEYILLGEDGTVRTDEGYPVLQYATGKFWVNNHTHVIRAKQPYNNFFIWNYLKKKNIDEIVTGAVQPKINQANLKSIDFPKYPENLVIEFNKISELFFKKINQNKTQIRTLAALRDILLPKLMSGEIRVL